MTPSPRERLQAALAQGVAESRRRAALDAPRPGCFDRMRALPNINFATIGRRSGRRHTKSWLPFAADADTLYLVEEIGLAANWVQNALAAGTMEVWEKSAADSVVTVPRIVTDADELARARRLVAAKFGGGAWDFVDSGFVVALEVAAR